MKPKGFTLIELLIVVAIIGILAAIAVPNFLNAQVRAKVAHAQSDMQALSTALEMYNMDNNHYPYWVKPDGTYVNPLPARFYPLTTPIAYMSSVPQDPFIYGPPGARINENQDAAYTTYDYVESRGSIKFAGVTVLPPSRRCAEWRISSAGPDGTNTYGNYYSYDASNGLRSFGDIVRTGPRMSFPCDSSLVGK
ncbi:MAG: prepilin-type N-terminal cleavage/methylation domain-containing protein [Candidatus Omnitrophica bacterium]|nr:prepilin-type N-terminal cleavage/methylation domain-containing protein [Candidatus Omnitrophota bacterium]HPO99342.1 prepilin-type N-terminal cleavage/methylation domain-containing protein [bacterium]HXK92346.1 prepilin-type N-terminal cleavage/methylation domain-containing protein [bacterium]